MFYSGAGNGSKKGHLRGELSEFKTAPDLIEIGCRVSYTHGEYPYNFAGYVPERDTVFYVPFKEAGQNASVTYPPRKERREHHISKAKFGDDYSFEKAVKRIQSEVRSFAQLLNLQQRGVRHSLQSICTNIPVLSWCLLFNNQISKSFSNGRSPTKNIRPDLVYAEWK